MYAETLVHRHTLSNSNVGLLKRLTAPPGSNSLLFDGDNHAITEPYWDQLHSIETSGN